jgi:glycosyltransferase involved in cell wall biosynthesis
VTAAAESWVLVTGDVGQRGGQDKANHALATALLARGATVHLVAHEVCPALASHPRARVHRVPRPAGSHLAGAPLLDWTGRRVAREVRAGDARARVVVNGGNCAVADVSWVHAVHAAWRSFDAGAPLAARIKNRLAKRLALRGERRVVRGARVVVANSERTRRDLERLGVPPGRIRVVYLGTDPERFGPVGDDERAAARRALAIPPGAAVLLFVGALGYEAHKGFDRVLEAVAALGERGRDFLVLAAGGGALAWWQRRAASLGVAGRVRFLGHADDVPALLAAADLLVSPCRYEAYGLNVQEALCRGVPALVTGTAGVAERFPLDLADLLVADPEDPRALSRSILAWHARRAELAAAARRAGDRLRSYRWSDMADAFLRAVEVAPAAGERERA